MGWISVKDRLPERDGSYIVHSSKSGSVFVAHFWAGHRRWSQKSHNKYITHWMPLPEPPAEHRIRRSDMNSKENAGSLTALAKEIHRNAVDHGWWDDERTFGDIIALCHSELSEALEEYRAKRPFLWFACKEGEPSQPCDPADETDCFQFGHEAECQYRDKKPEGIAVEMIDCIIRILDWCGRHDIDVDTILAMKHEYNKSRPYRHGGKQL